MKNLNYFTFLLVTFVAISVNAQFGISAKGGAFIPVGEFEKVYTSGIGGEVTFIYRTNPSFEFGITTGYSHYNADEDVLKDRILEDIKDDIENTNSDAISDVESPLNIIPLVFNIKYLFGTKKIKPYFFFEGGIFFYDQTTRVKVEIANNPTYDVPETVVDESSTMLGIGGGLQYRITKKLFFDLSAKWSIMNNIKFLEADINEELKGVDKTAQTIGIIGGLSYYF
jgi:opacity protein-like surface antigen